MALNVIYLHMLGCMVKPRLDLESTHGCFGIFYIFVQPVEALLIWMVGLQV